MKNLFKSIFSNQAVLDSRKSKWYWVLCFFVLSMFLPWIPVLKNGYTGNCAALMTNVNNNEIDKGFKTLLERDYFKTITVVSDGTSYSLNMDGLNNTDYYSDTAYVNEYNGQNDKELARGTYLDTATGNASAGVTKHTGLSSTYYYDVVSVSSEGQITAAPTSSTSSSVIYEEDGTIRYLQAYYFPEVTSTYENYTQYLSNFISSVVFDVNSDNTVNNYPHSYVIFTKDSINIVSYKLKSSKSSLSASATYSGRVNDGFGTTTVVDGTKFVTYLYGDSTSLTDAYDHLVTYLHNAAKGYATHSAWVNIGFISAVTAVTILLTSLILLFLNKRKTSIYRDTNYWGCIIEAVLMCFTPALIAMAIGFANLQYEIVALIGCALIRVVWSSSKICPPAATGGADKPLYQARS